MQILQCPQNFFWFAHRLARRADGLAYLTRRLAVLDQRDGMLPAIDQRIHPVGRMRCAETPRQQATCTECWSDSFNPVQRQEKIFRPT